MSISVFLIAYNAHNGYCIHPLFICSSTEGAGFDLFFLYENRSFSRRGIPVTGSLFLMLSLLFFIYCASSSLKGSPHSGQNFGGLVGSSGTQPHLSHLYLRTAAGLAFPHSTQNFPLLTAPQEQVQLPLGAAGFGFPHSGQNFPVAVVPQEAHTQLSAAAV